MTRLSLVGLAIAALVLGGACGDDAEIIEAPVQMATLADLTGPWRAVPFRLDDAMRARVAEACRRDIQLPPGSVAAVIDARGAGVVTIRMTGAGAGNCDALEITGRGDVTGAGAAWSQNGPENPGPIGGGELAQVQRGQIGGGSLTVEGWSVYGRAGPAIALVQVALPDGQLVVASLERGWFSAWWRGHVPDGGGFVDPFPRVVVRAFDAAGVLLDEATPE